MSRNFEFDPLPKFFDYKLFSDTTNHFELFFVKIGQFDF